MGKKKNNPDYFIIDILNRVNFLDQRLDRLEINIAIISKTLKNHEKLIWFILTLVASLVVKAFFL
jgi:phosphatidylglycerophosphate synthase